MLCMFISRYSTSRRVFDVAVRLQLASLGSSASCEAQTVDYEMQTVSWRVLVSMNTLLSFRTLNSKRECPKTTILTTVYDVKLMTIVSTVRK